MGGLDTCDPPVEMRDNFNSVLADTLEALAIKTKSRLGTYDPTGGVNVNSSSSGASGSSGSSSGGPCCVPGACYDCNGVAHPCAGGSSSGP